MKHKTFTGVVGRTVDDTIYRYRETDDTPPGAPNIVYIVLDDLGFAQLGCYGSSINTPNIDRLAAEGLRYNNFHTTAVCSATRASLLTGTNHHTAGVPALVDTPTGATNNHHRLKPEYATVAEVLKEYGYATFALGKWHLDANPCGAGTPIGWPLQKGFDRYYGFLHAENDQFHPNLVRDNTAVPQPKSVAEGYHFSEDITDNAIDYLHTHHMNYPGQPFFLYLAYGAMHAPHHAPRAYIERYRGAFDEGWDVLRQRCYERQLQLGVIPPGAELTARNEHVPAWSSLNAKQRAVAAREMEAYAGMLEHTDAQIGRVLEYLQQSGQLDDTAIVLLSDNGASCEGGPAGRFNSLVSMDMTSTLDDEIDYAYEHLDEIGSELAFSHYASGWANLGNVPFPWYKIMAHEGGTKDPLIIRYPRAVPDPGAVRGQYHHVSDITPTVLELLGVEKPATIKGVAQRPCTGTSLFYTLGDADAPDEKHIQYYEVLGNRALYKDGWKAVVNHTFSESYDDDVWELYHVAEDYSENHDVAALYPEKLRELQEDFMHEAGVYDVFPMMRGSMHAGPGKMAQMGPARFPEKTSVFRNVIKPVQLVGERDIAAYHLSHTITARVFRASTAEEGALYAQGSRFGGVAFYVKANRLVYVYNANLPRIYTVRSDAELPAGALELAASFEVHADGSAEVVLYVDGAEAGRGYVAHVGGLKGFETTLGANFFSAVSPEYEPPFAFAGRIDEVVLHQVASDADAATEIARLMAVE